VSILAFNWWTILTLAGYAAGACCCLILLGCSIFWLSEAVRRIERRD